MHLPPLKRRECSAPERADLQSQRLWCGYIPVVCARRADRSSEGRNLVTQQLDATAAAKTTTGTVTSGSLNRKRLPELQALADELGLKGTTRMRKSDLIAAIIEAASPGAPESPAASTTAPKRAAQRTAPQDAPAQQESPSSNTSAERSEDARTTADAPSARAHQPAATETAETPREQRDKAPREQREREQPQSREQQRSESRQSRGQQRRATPDIELPKPMTGDGAATAAASDDAHDSQPKLSLDTIELPSPRGEEAERAGRNDQRRRQDDPRGDNQGRGRRRSRDRNRRRRGSGQNDLVTYDEPQISEDDVLLPVAGILDVLDNYAFVRTSGYLPGDNDVYVSLNQIRRNGLRRGDAITGMVRQPREGENQRQKFNALVRIDTVNGATVEEMRRRPEFSKLTPLYPNEHLRLETEPSQITARVIDMVAPIGKG